jgi:hypothetical protein
LSLLKKIDPMYTVNTERTFQARNVKAHEVELLAAPSVLANLPAGELSPIEGMIAQEWLLYGQSVNHVVCGTDRKPTRLICPDPRWMALHKTWLSQQPERKAAKRTKDAGRLLFAAVKTLMPHYPMDALFQAELPDILKPVFAGLLHEFETDQGASLDIAPPRRSR